MSVTRGGPSWDPNPRQVHNDLHSFISLTSAETPSCLSKHEQTVLIFSLKKANYNVHHHHDRNAEIEQRGVSDSSRPLTTKDSK